MGATSSSSAQINLPVYSGDNFRLDLVKEEEKWEEPSSKPEGERGGLVEGSGGVVIGGPSGSAVDDVAGPFNLTSGGQDPGGQDPGGGDSFKWVTQTRLKRISLIMEYITEHRVINGHVDVMKVCSM